MTTCADTNAVLAFARHDRARQRAAVAEYADRNGRLVVSESVLAECCWVLLRTYAQPAEDVALQMRELLETSTFDAWDPELAQTALELMARHPRLGFTDCLLAARAQRGDAVYTFDRRLAEVIQQL